MKNLSVPHLSSRLASPIASNLLKNQLEEAFLTYHRSYFLTWDPLQYAHRFSKLEDREIAAFVISLLSYGNVVSIRKSLDALFVLMGPSPYEYIYEKKYRGNLEGFYHRFTRGVDLEIVFDILSHILKRQRSIEGFYQTCRKESAHPLCLKESLSTFTRKFWETPISKSYDSVREQRTLALKHLIPSPDRGSACKRINLFLRWVTRPNDGIDLGLWTCLSPKDLILPLDTHLLKTAQKFRWTTSKTASWKVAESITEYLRIYDASDPTRFDFALCHLSMLGQKRNPRLGSKPGSTSTP